MSTNGDVDRVQNFAQGSEILRRLRVGDIIGVQLDGVSLKFLYNDEFYPIWNCVNNRNQRQIHGIVDLYGGIFGVELVNYEELFPNSAIFDYGYLSPQVPAVPDFITIYEQVQASLRSLGFHESSEGKKISDKVFKRRLKDKLEAYFRNSWNQKRLENLYDLNDYNSRLLLESKKLSLESRYFIVEVTIILKETFSEDI